jgi:hypothetical protein
VEPITCNPSCEKPSAIVRLMTEAAQYAEQIGWGYQDEMDEAAACKAAEETSAVALA